MSKADILELWSARWPKQSAASLTRARETAAATGSAEEDKMEVANHDLNAASRRRAIETTEVEKTKTIDGMTIMTKTTPNLIVWSWFLASLGVLACGLAMLVRALFCALTF